jgi:hypothetical protein
MMDQLTIAKTKVSAGIYLPLIVALILGCASHDAAVSDRNELKKIVDLVMHETPDSLVLSIRGNQKLTPTEDKQAGSKKIILYFPDTSLDGVNGLFIPPENDLIRSIKTGQSVQNETTVSAIVIALKRDEPYEVTPDKSGLQISFTKRPAHGSKIVSQKDIPEMKPKSPLTPKSVPRATVLRTVSTESFENTVAVHVEADGTIKNFKTFTIANPARIVYDLYNIRSSHAGEQKITVQSKEVQQIRYFGHPDKLRLVIETHEEYLSKYSSESTDTGMVIHVGSDN